MLDKSVITTDDINIIHCLRLSFVYTIKLVIHLISRKLIRRSLFCYLKHAYVVMMIYIKLDT